MTGEDFALIAGAAIRTTQAGHFLANRAPSSSVSNAALGLHSSRLWPVVFLNCFFPGVA